jgi:uncharacterized BrkB/YihY/UPF0761 family membrane protein
VHEQVQSSLPEEVLTLVAERLVYQGQEVAESKLLPFGIVFFAIWSASGLAWALLEGLNTVHEVEKPALCGGVSRSRSSSRLFSPLQ